MTPKEAREKIKQHEDFSPGWYRRATGISGHEERPEIAEIKLVDKVRPMPDWTSWTVKEKPPLGPPLTASPTLGTYLTKWLETATGGRVYLNQRRGRFLNFKCNECGDNWNVSEDCFAANGQQAIPWELSEWVDKHHHVCKQWSGSATICATCKWPYHKHAEAQPVFDATKNEWVATKPPVGCASAPVTNLPGADLTGIKVAKNPTGRKFRE